MEAMTRREWRREKRRLFWAKHPGLAGLVAGSFLLAPPSIMIAIDKGARESVVRFVQDCFLPFMAAAVLTIVFLSIIAVLEREEEEKWKK
jgi:hypothetical protein